MAIVGGYVMDLYCDNDKSVEEVHEHGPRFEAATRNECKRMARAAGWKFYHHGKVSCPTCNKKKEA